MRFRRRREQVDRIDAALERTLSAATEARDQARIAALLSAEARSHSEAAVSLAADARGQATRAAAASIELQTQLASRGRQRSPAVMAAVMLAVAAGAAIGGWWWMPPERIPPSAANGLPVSVASGSVDIDAAEVSINTIGDRNDRWWIRVVIHTSDPKPWQEESEPNISIDGVSPAPCEELTPPAASLNQLKICERTQARLYKFERSKQRMVMAPATWIQEIGDSADTTPPKSGAVVSFYVAATDQDVGIALSDSEMKVSLPEVEDYRAESEPATLQVQASILRRGLSDLEWSGLSPHRATPFDGTEWHYLAEREDPEWNLATGINRGTVEQDQQDSFFSGILFGLAAGAAIAALEYVLHIRRRHS